MDPASIDPKILGRQLYKPEGELGKQVGEMMAKRHGEAMALTLKFLDLQPADRVLEIGFGSGDAVAEAVRLTPEGHVSGIDFSETMLAMAEERNKRAIVQDRAELTLGDAKELPYDDDTFDKVFAMNVFHFWPDPSRELAECKRVLTAGGKVVFYLTHHSQRLAGTKESGCFSDYEPEKAEQFLRDAGFRDVGSHLTSAGGRKCFVFWGTK
jgi:ubiquinone/menaquinone biosynthesis C-methylase UbiE